MGHEGDTKGSIWTGGFSGQSVEFHGNFSSRYADTIDGLDYCAPDTTYRTEQNPTPSPSMQPSVTPPIAALRLYKRTHFSTHADGDAAFLAQNLGLEVRVNRTYSAGRADPRHGGGGRFECAKRVELSALAYQVHLVESETTPTGNLSTAEWVSYWRELHNGFADGWDQFMANAQTFYAPDLTPFALRTGANGVPAAKKQYVSPVDGVRLYSLSLLVPNTGHVVEVVSEQLEGQWRGGFSHLSGESCAEARYVSISVDQMRASWERHGGSYANANAGLPDLLLVKASFAATVPGELTKYFRNFDTGSVLDDKQNGQCQYSTVRVKMGQHLTHQHDDVDVRAVADLSARVGDWTPGFYARYVDAQHMKFVGLDGDSGWDRYLDSHLGFALEDGRELDALTKPLLDAEIPYRAHVYAASIDSVADGSALLLGDDANASSSLVFEGAAGAVWTGGVAGQGIEISGNFSRETALTLDELDLCSATSSSRAANPTSAPTPAPTVTPPLAALRLFKRAHFSSHASADAAFLQRHFGLALVTNRTYEGGAGRSGRFECARVAHLEALSYEVHLVESSTSPTGNLSTADWVSEWRGLHGDIGTSGWDQFMANSQTFYAPDLTPFVEATTKGGVDTLRVRYVNPLDGMDTFSLAAVVPNTGHLIEVISEQLSERLRDGFEDGWDATACAEANYAPQPTRSMKAAWDEHGGALVNDAGFPDLLIVKVIDCTRRVASSEDVSCQDSLFEPRRVTATAAAWSRRASPRARAAPPRSPTSFRPSTPAPRSRPRARATAAGRRRG